MSHAPLDQGMSRPDDKYGWSLLTNDALFLIARHLYSGNPPTPITLDFPAFLDHLFLPFPGLRQVYLKLRWTGSDKLQRDQIQRWLIKVTANMPGSGLGRWHFMMASLTLVEIMQYIVDNFDNMTQYWVTRNHLEVTWNSLYDLSADETKALDDNLQALAAESKPRFPLMDIVEQMGQREQFEAQACLDTEAIRNFHQALVDKFGEDQVSPILTLIEDDKPKEKGRVYGEGYIHDQIGLAEKEEALKAHQDEIRKVNDYIEDIALGGTSKEEIELKERLQTIQDEAEKDGINLEPSDESITSLKDHIAEELESNGDMGPTPEQKETTKKKIFEEIELAASTRMNELHKRNTKLEEQYILITKEMREVGHEIFELQNPDFQDPEPAENFEQRIRRHIRAEIIFEQEHRSGLLNRTLFLGPTEENRVKFLVGLPRETVEKMIARRQLEMGIIGWRHDGLPYFDQAILNQASAKLSIRLPGTYESMSEEDMIRAFKELFYTE